MNIPGSRLRRLAPGSWGQRVRPRSSRLRRVVPVLSVAGLLLLTACGSEEATSSPSTKAPEQALACEAQPSKPPVSGGLPDVTLPCLGDGPDVRLADLRGPLVLNVWAQWCGPCREEAPFLAELQKKAGGKVKLLGIDYADPRRELAIEFAGEHGLDYPHLVDAEKAVQQPLKIGGPPLTAFVDQDGKVVHVHRGVLKSQQELDQLVKDKLGVDL